MTASRAGGPRLTGRFERPSVPFALATDLTAPGALAVGDAVERVVADWERQAKVGGVKVDTVGTHRRTLRTLATYLRNRGVRLLVDVDHDLLWGWVHSAKSTTGQAATDNMRALRREVAKTFYLTCYRLGLTDANPAAALHAIARSSRFVCALSDAQVQQAKSAANYEVALPDDRVRRYEPGSIKGPSALALVLCGAQPGEVGFITCDDIDLVAQLVWASGGGDRYRPRWLPITDPWVFDALATRIAWLAKQHPDTYRSMPVAYEPTPGKADDFARRSAATSRTLDTILVKAGLKEPGRVRVASILEWVAASVFAQTGRVEAVAARLGMSRLDAAAHLVGYDWRDEFATPGPDGTLAGPR